MGAVEGIAAVAKERAPLVRGANLFYDCSNAGIPSRGTIDCLTTLPEHLLVQVTIGMAIVHLKDSQRCSICHFLYSFHCSVIQNASAATINSAAVMSNKARSEFFEGPSYFSLAHVRR
jgi:hypothetical protein